MFFTGRVFFDYDFNKLFSLLIGICQNMTTVFSYLQVVALVKYNFIDNQFSRV